jgi:membrane-bound ClpP family serine protease
VNQIPAEQILDQAIASIERIRLRMIGTIYKVFLILTVGIAVISQELEVPADDVTGLALIISTVFGLMVICTAVQES